jgi:hypothetical protein
MQEQWGPPEYVRGQRPGDLYVRWRRRRRLVPPQQTVGPLRGWPGLSPWLKGVGERRRD